MRKTGWLIGLALIVFWCGAAQADWRGDVKQELAARQYLKALKILDDNKANAEDVGYLAMRGEALFELGRILDARADLEKAIAKDDNSLDAHATLALVLAKQRIMAEANKHAERAVAVAKTPRSLYARAIVYLGAGMLDKSDADLVEGLRLDANQPDLYLVRGAICRMHEKYADAAQLFDQAISHDKRPYKAYLERATTAVLRGDPVSSKADIEQAIKIAPEMYHGFLGRGFIAQEYGDNEAALADFNKASTLAPQVAEIHFARANLLVALGRHAEAEKVLTAAKPVCQDIPDWYVMLSLIQGELKKPEAAMATLNELIGKTPDQWQGYNLRGQLHASLNELDLAVADFDQAIAVAPKAPEPQLNKVTVLIAQKKSDEALTMLNAIIKQYPNALLPIEMRMQLYQALGKNKEALADLQKIQELKKKQ